MTSTLAVRNNKPTIGIFSAHFMFKRFDDGIMPVPRTPSTTNFSPESEHQFKAIRNKLKKEFAAEIEYLDSSDEDAFLAKKITTLYDNTRAMYQATTDDTGTMVWIAYRNRREQNGLVAGFKLDNNLELCDVSEIYIPTEDDIDDVPAEFIKNGGSVAGKILLNNHGSKEVTEGMVATYNEMVQEFIAFAQARAGAYQDIITVCEGKQRDFSSGTPTITDLLVSTTPTGPVYFDNASQVTAFPELDSTPLSGASGRAIISDIRFDGPEDEDALIVVSTVLTEQGADLFMPVLTDNIVNFIKYVYTVPFTRRCGNWIINSDCELTDDQVGTLIGKLNDWVSVPRPRLTAALDLCVFQSTK